MAKDLTTEYLGLKLKNPLPHRYQSAHDPINRAALQYFGRALRKHAGNMLHLAAGFPFLLPPFLELLQLAHPNAEFDHVQRHHFNSGTIVHSRSPSLTCWPSAIEMSATEPATGARSTCSIFMASRTSNLSPI